MKDIIIIAQYTHLPGKDSNGRFRYIADIISKTNNNVEVITTDFSHVRKEKRYLTKESLHNIKYKVTLLNEPGYKKNFSVKRFYSHHVLGKNLTRYLKGRRKPDIIYCAVPSLSFAMAAAKYAQKNDVRFIIDVQDIWPEAFKIILNIPVLSDIIYYPMKKQADYIYSAADEIVAVSQTYVDIALQSNKKCTSGLSVFLGTNLNYFDGIAKAGTPVKKPENEIWVAYIGTLGHNYDLTSIIDALKIIKGKGISNIKFVVMGSGPMRSKFENHAKQNDIYAEFTGRLNYGDMVKKLTVCDIAVNPIIKDSACSIINKVGDYAAAGLPVISTQEGKEYKDLITGYNAGYNCENGNPQDIAKKLLKMIENKQVRDEMGKNNRRLAEDKFDREHTYPQIIELLYRK